MSATETQTLDPAIEAKHEALKAILRRQGRVVVAYSGGVDSALVLKVATETLGPENALGVTARSETLTDREFEEAARIAGEHGFNLKIVSYSELEIENYAANPTNRCYFCKGELYGRLTPLMEEFGAGAICNGDNYDDVGDYRPGMKAAAEARVISPLKDARMAKADVRALARHLGLSNWDKPSGACLSSRIPYGQTITKEMLRAVGDGEGLLRDMGFRQVRVRHHGGVARIEVGAEEIARFADRALRAEAGRGIRALGFEIAALDLMGYRTGSLNADLFKKKNGAPPTASRIAPELAALGLEAGAEFRLAGNILILALPEPLADCLLRSEARIEAARRMAGLGFTYCVITLQG